MIATRPHPIDAPAEWLGWQEMLPGAPALGLWNLTRDIPGHPRGSTVSSSTLLRAGYLLPAIPDMEVAR
jgi:hypothetical protein